MSLDNLDKPKKKGNILRAAALGLYLVLPVQTPAQAQGQGPYIETQQDKDFAAFVDKKKIELETNPKFRDGYRVLRSWVNEAGLHCMEFLTPAITQSGAWIVKEIVCEDPDNKQFAPIGDAKLEEVIENWGPGTFEDDLKQMQKH